MLNTHPKNAFIVCVSLVGWSWYFTGYSIFYCLFLKFLLEEAGQGGRVFSVLFCIFDFCIATYLSICTISMLM